MNRNRTRNNDTRAMRELALRQARSLLGHDPSTPLEDDLAVDTLTALILAADLTRDGLLAVPGWIYSRSSEPVSILLRTGRGDLAAAIETALGPRGRDAWDEIALSLVTFGAPTEPEDRQPVSHPPAA